MDTLIERKRTSFRFRKDLIARLENAAKRENRSLNNYVENILMDAVYNEPNDETVAAIEEARANKNLKTVDMTNLDTFVKSCCE